MSNATMMEECICPMDCEYVSYAINKNEEVINPQEYCKGWESVGDYLSKQVVGNEFNFKYKTIAMYNFSEDLSDRSVLDIRRKIC